MNYVKEVGIIVIGCLTGYALYLGHNGVIFAGVIGTIASMAGYEVGLKKKEK